MRKFYLFLALVCMAHLSHSQLRMAILGGGHSASIKEENSIPSWETTIKPGYSSKGGLHLGILVEVPLSANNRLFFQPGILYTEKGRKFYMRNDTATSIATDTISAAYTLAVNYIDIPLNLTYKLPLSKKANFFLSAGPYIGLFYNGKQKNETRIYSSNSFKDEDVRLEAGNGAGRYQTFDYGWNARAGFEIGSVMLSGFMSEGLASHYTASYDGQFRHQVRGASLGIWLNKAKPPKSKVAKKPIVVPPAPKPEPPAPKVVPDTDGDGMNDEADGCPTEKGVPEFNGCPVPDSDGDGVNDLEDKCTMEKGPASNNGCPEVKRDTITKVMEEKVSFAARNIFFKPNSDELTESSIEPLNEVVNMLYEHPSLKLQIDGHTDATGKAETNARLSKQRAESVKNYLTGKGIDPSRLTATGYGPSKPLQSNATPEGRQKNRRVELKLAQ
ncbi:MAG: OmpA family protein [Chitinophagaceae bacterium]|nr:OmpA family protein [Chitinophagaceae bacterium]